MGQTVTIIAPDGTPRAIPAEQADAAIQAGGKQAVRMVDPTGTPRWVSTDQQDAALKAGGKLAPSDSGQGFFSSFGDQNAIVQGAKMLGHAVMHPADTIQAISHAGNPFDPQNPIAQAVTGTAQNTVDNIRQGVQDYRQQGLSQQTRRDFGRAVPVVGPALAKAQTQYDAGNGAGAAGTIAGVVSNAITPGNIKAGAPSVLDSTLGAVDSAAGAASSLKNRLYPTSQSLVPDVSAARNLSKALVIDPAGVNNFVKSAADEAGTVMGYAKEKGLPINSKVDFANAAKQTADAAQSHYDENILAPNAKRVTAVPASYQGPTVGEGNNATLGAINDRINAINSELKSNFRKPLQAQTSAANTSDAELLSEKNALTSVLHKKLGDATGLPPEAIADLRQQAGKLRTIADESQLSANRDLTAAGRQGMGATTTSSIGTKAGIIDRTLQAVQGGPEVIGNRQVLSALKKVAPKPLDLPEPTPIENIPPAPRPPTGGPSTIINGPDYTPDPNAASALKDKISARQAAPIKQMQQWANNGAAKLVQHEPNLTTADIELLKKSPVGKQILIKASSLTPGSPAMESLFPQIQAALSMK